MYESFRDFHYYMTFRSTPFVQRVPRTGYPPLQRALYERGMGFITYGLTLYFDIMI